MTAHSQPLAAQQLGVPWVALFGGQGAPSGQMAELRRVAAVPRVRAFLQEMSDQLHSEIEHRVDPIVAARHLTTGLPIASWADGSSTPSFTYLSSLPVTLVLTFVVQLAAYHYSAEYTEHPAGAVGHSQGQAAALAISLASDAGSGTNVAFAFARVLLQLGVAIAEAVRLRHGDAEASTEGLAATSFALAVLKIPVAEVSRLAASFYDVQPPCRRSKSGSGEDHVEVAGINGAEACLVTASPARLSAFEAYLDAWAHGHGHKMTTKRLPVGAPFHNANWLRGAADECMRRNVCEPPLWTTQLTIPVWSCIDGTRLSAATLPPLELQSHLIRSLTLEPVHWPQTLSALARALPAARLVDFGPGGGAGALRVSAVVARELEGLESLACVYFTQTDGVHGGPLPGSWLSWVRTPETTA